MDSSVKTRPNHYETLGLTPEASSDEIARAYARGIGAFGSRSLTDVAAASIAFETLRDPAKRRVYNESIGIGRAPQPTRIAWTAGRAQYLGQAPAAFAAEMLHPRISAFKTAPKQPPEEPRTASFIAASLRPPSDRAPEPAPVRPEPEVRQVIGQRPPVRTADRPVSAGANLRLADADESAIPWSRTAIVGGGLVAAVVLVGAVAGWQAGHGEEQQPVEAQARVTASLPAPRPVAEGAAAAPASVSAAPQAQPRQGMRVPVRSVRAVPPAEPRTSARIEQLAEAIRSAPTPIETPVAEETSAGPAAVETAAAMPLPSATVARTIERIGYSCGKVASTSAIEGSAGAFKVTCTSGQSYRAAPVGGRYRFHRMGSR